MAPRTTKTTVTFEQPFVLAGLDDEVLPAGMYTVETDEELLEGLSFTAYRRVLTVIHLPSPSGNRLLSRALTIDPAELEAALTRDNALTEVAARRKARSETMENNETRADRHPESK